MTTTELLEKATKRPWKLVAVDASGDGGKFVEWKIVSDDGEEVCTVWRVDECGASTAALILRAVNSFEAMRGTMIAAREGIRQITSLANINAETRRMLIATGNNLNEALALADGKEPKMEEAKKAP